MRPGRVWAPRCPLALAETMITISSNIATDLIIERIGLSGVADFRTESGLGADLRLERLAGETAAERVGLTDSVTAGGLARLFVDCPAHPG